MWRRVILISALFLLGSSLLWAQDPEGQLDYLDVVCGTQGYWGTGGNEVCFQVRLFSDNTGINRIQGVGLPLLITGSNIVAVDTSISSAFSGSVIGHFELLSVVKHGDPDPSIPPFHVTYGAVSLSQVAAGNGTAFNICLTVNDTGTICIDTLSSGFNIPILTTGQAIGFIPGWGGTTGQGYPDGQGICCQLPICNAKPGDADASGTLTLADVISIIRYYFNLPVNGGCSPQPICWISGLLCRGDWNGDGSVKLADIIYGVNYIFNRPGGPWTPKPTGLCCLPVP